MKTTSKPTRSSRPKSPTNSAGGKRGNMTPREIQPLLMAARKAFDCQERAGLLDEGEKFDAWRHRQCMEAVGKPGLTACHHADYKPLLAHFQTLAGDDSAAFENLMKSGKAKDHGPTEDTHEERRQLASVIADALAWHAYLAVTSIEEIARDYGAGKPAGWLSRMIDCQQAIAKHGRPINIGYLVYLVRQKTKRPDLTLGNDWQAGLAERCTVAQLAQIRNTVINRIAAVEGRGETRNRNTRQGSKAAKEARSPREIAPRGNVQF